jgi:phospholipid/cholesterol/gamma-HCH transport system substrate-binding protein
MLTRFVKIQLVIFSIASIVGMSAMAVVYLRAPVMLGIGRITVTLELPETGGLYQLANVTYRGMQIGQVTDVKLTATGARVTLSLSTSPQVPADLVAQVRSVSAIGEQYVDLRPRDSSPPYLHDGSVIPVSQSAIPQPVGPMLDRTSALLSSVPTDKVSALLDESSKALNDAGYDLGSLLDSAATVAHDMRGVTPHLRSLIDDSRPLLDGQAASTNATRTWTRSLAGVTGQLVDDDRHIRTILAQGPATLQEVSRLMDSVKPTLPVLLANLTSISQVAVTYLPSLEQLLVLIPPYMANLQAALPSNNATGLPPAAFRIEASDPPACTVGFLPPSQWRSPADTTTMDTPDGLYCKLPQDSPTLVRGARNLPCMEHPGKRAPTVEICNSAQPYMPLATRQHALGPGPLDPNLIAQGVEPDDRVTRDEHIFGPIEGTSQPPDSRPATPASGAPAAPSAPPGDTEVPAPPPAGQGGADAAAAPSAFHPDSSGAPAISVATYDPRTGRYMTPAGQVHQQTDLVTHASTWKDLVLTRPQASP